MDIIKRANKEPALPGYLSRRSAEINVEQARERKEESMH